MNTFQEVSGFKIDVTKGETVEYAGRAIVGLMNGDFPLISNTIIENI